MWHYRGSGIVPGDRRIAAIRTQDQAKSHNRDGCPIVALSHDDCIRKGLLL